MKGRKNLRRGILCVCMVAVELFLYFGLREYIEYKKNEEAKQLKAESEFCAENEFLRTIDCAKIFDTFPGASFEISFEICAKKPGEVLVYQQNGASYKYTFGQKISVTEEFQEVKLVVEPVLVNEAVVSSYLAFYGEYGSGVVPTVRNISVKLVE